jgi:hypothetical protein
MRRGETDYKTKGRSAKYVQRMSVSDGRFFARAEWFDEAEFSDRGAGESQCSFGIAKVMNLTVG